MSKLIDLTGKTFYELTVLAKAPSSKDGKTRWYCRCSCGKTVIASGYDLRNGKHKSCGHDRKHPYTDLTGLKFGDLTVISRNPDATWLCQCNCGKTINAKSQELTSGHTKGCGHSRRFMDLTGQKFGEWTALRYLGNSFWECRCSCGKVSKVHSYSLRTGGSLSCGHNSESKLREDLAGRQFNDWKVLSYEGGRHSLWRCQCSCGTIKNVAAYDLKNGNTRNCGHNRKIPHENLVGRKFGQLTVIEYIGKGTYKCKCSCGNFTTSGSYSLITGDKIGCGCQQIKSKYTKDVMESAILDYTNKHGSKPFTADLADELNITFYYTNQLLNKYDLKYLMNTKFGSAAERDIFMYVQSLVGADNIISKDRKALGNGKELDVYVPSKKIAIEYNGNFWHRENAIGANYHLEKTESAIRNGIRLIHIFEYEWNDPIMQEKLKYLIKGVLDSNKNIMQARKCNIKQVDIQEEREFTEKYHLQGYVASTIAYGLYSEKGELVSLMSFGKPRFNTNYEWEIIRYCNHKDIGIIGGAEKLFNHFIDEYKPSSVISYCDLSKFTGRIYTKLGFDTNRESLTPPNYVWVYGNEVLHRYQTQKKKLLDSGLGMYGDTEDEIMMNLGYEKVYDCGNIRYTWKSNNSKI